MDIALLTKNHASYRSYESDGGGRGFEQALGVGAGPVIDALSESGLRGRGGGGFPTGRKWSSVRDGGGELVVCNAAEGEPATFKDRYLIRRNPYQVLEGLAIAASALNASRARIGIKDTFGPEIERLEGALREMRAAGALADVEVDVVAGPDHFLLGEETGMLEALEGREPLPTGVQAFVRGPDAGSSVPVLVNNVETLANVPHIVAEGPQWLRRCGTDASPGTAVFTVCGDVEREGCFELALGTPLRELIEDHAGGVRNGRALKVIVPGASHHVITPERLDTPLTYEDMEAAGSALGACGFAVFDERRPVAEILRMYTRFLYIESCGQCPPCKDGTGAIHTELESLVAGEVEGPGAFDTVMSQAGYVMNGRKCELPTGTRHVVESLLRLFADEVRSYRPPEGPPRLPAFPKITDHDQEAHRFVYDDAYHRKRPDWTFASAR